MQAWQRTSSESVGFTTEREMIEVPLPGGIGTPRVSPKPETGAKDGWVGSNRTKVFSLVFISGSQVEGQEPVTVVDKNPAGRATSRILCASLPFQIPRRVGTISWPMGQ